jgi:hypothetical protein
VDITGYRAAIREVARVLNPGRRLIAANVSNIASTSEAPVRDESGRFLYYAVDRYLEEWPMTLEWAGLRIRNWHRPLSAYMDAYLSAGLTLRRYLEPVPRDQARRDDPRFESWFRVPSFDTMVCGKKRRGRSTNGPFRFEGKSLACPDGLDLPEFALDSALRCFAAIRRSARSAFWSAFGTSGAVDRLTNLLHRLVQVLRGAGHGVHIRAL